MPSVDCLRSVPIERTPRVKQLEGLFDVPPADRSERRWQVSLPLEERDWNVGLIVGPSGCGKSTLARACFGKQPEPSWPSDRAIVDVFPAALGIKEIVSLLSSVGFSSPPAWLRPYHALSTGEQFRVQMARALAECAPITVIDEFTSVVDRTVARIGSAAIARTVRARGTKFVAVTCHYDVAHWLDADWIYDSAADEFSWRCLQGRPRITLAIARVHRSAWRLFKPHHYLSGDLNPSARCFVAFVEDRPAAFAAVISGPDAHGGHFREHRVVCLPDFQGVGIGNALSEFVASLYVSRKTLLLPHLAPGHDSPSDAILRLDLSLAARIQTSAHAGCVRKNWQHAPAGGQLSIRRSASFGRSAAVWDSEHNQEPSLTRRVSRARTPTRRVSEGPSR